ncbi:MAG: potassium/proton antiporter, partial [Hymenobacteraceae bacterium]|nr:potassium/proton antiporter [Hymenobacteraceae bacterium]MDX5396327.1 potassium/proton antiporter [Hymenobacteraceae bacterium]MDX5512387.1 potassium/proton antiporter [Hymenobacteraceae bacterium]
MNVTVDDILFVGSVLLLISVVASKSSGKVGVPLLVLFLGIGMLAGSDGIGGIYFNDPRGAQSIGVIALAFILFSGGLDTRWESVKPVVKPGLVLSTVGVLATALLVGAFVTLITDFTWLEGLLLGAVVSSTDAAAVFSILRAKSIGLKGNLRPLLELESGSNDPMAYFLTISFTALITVEEATFAGFIFSFFLQMLLGAAIGIGMGYGISWILNKIKLEYDGLYPVLTLALVIFTFSLTNEIKGNGFLAVYIAAVIMGNRNFIHKKSLMRFYDGIAWLMQILMFLTLGLLVFPKQIVPIIGLGFLIAFFLIVVARPVGVFLSLAFFKFPVREKVLISWVGLRGAAPIVFATYPLLAGVDKANLIFNLVFFMVLTSVMLQGTTISLAAKWLGLVEEEPKKLKHPMELELSDEMRNELFEITLNESSPAAGKPIVDLGLPKN